MKKIYIAGPISGQPNFNIDAFDHWAEAWRDVNYEVFNPVHTEVSKRTQAGELSGQQAYRECLGADLDWICREATAIFFMMGWQKSFGSLAEHATAVALGLEIFYEE